MVDSRPLRLPVPSQEQDPVGNTQRVQSVHRCLFPTFLFWDQVRRRKDGKRKSNDHGWFSVSGCAAGAGRHPCAHHPPKQHTAAQIRALVRAAVHLCRSTEHGGCLRQFRGDRGDRRGGAGRTAAGHDPAPAVQVRHPQDHQAGPETAGDLLRGGAEHHARLRGRLPGVPSGTGRPGMEGTGCTQRLVDRWFREHGGAPGHSPSPGGRVRLRADRGHGAVLGVAAAVVFLGGLRRAVQPVPRPKPRNSRRRTTQKRKSAPSTWSR